MTLIVSESGWSKEWDKYNWKRSLCSRNNLTTSWQNKNLRRNAASTAFVTKIAFFPPKWPNQWPAEDKGLEKEPLLLTRLSEIGSANKRPLFSQIYQSAQRKYQCYNAEGAAKPMKNCFFPKNEVHQRLDKWEDLLVREKVPSELRKWDQEEEVGCVTSCTGWHSWRFWRRWNSNSLLGCAFCSLRMEGTSQKDSFHGFERGYVTCDSNLAPTLFHLSLHKWIEY